MTRSPRSRFNLADLIVLFGCLAACYTVAGLGGLIAATSVETWYPKLAKPPFTPPDWVFAPVWLVLYTFIAVAAWLVYRRRRQVDVAAPFALFTIDLVFNLAWPMLFFGLNWIDGALAGITILFALVAVTTLLFWRVDKRAGLLFVPYLLWVGYATYLNAGIWRLN